MERDAQAYIFDIKENCDLILKFVREVELTGYRSNDLLKSAVERRFINIGEALARLKQVDFIELAKISDAGKIIAFRNVLVHGYESISDELIWEIIENYLPILRQECEELLGKSE